MACGTKLDCARPAPASSRGRRGTTRLRRAPSLSAVLTGHRTARPPQAPDPSPRPTPRPTMRRERHGLSRKKLSDEAISPTMSCIFKGSYRLVFDMTHFTAENATFSRSSTQLPRGAKCCQCLDPTPWTVACGAVPLWSLSGLRWRSTDHAASSLDAGVAHRLVLQADFAPAQPTRFFW